MPETPPSSLLEHLIPVPGMLQAYPAGGLNCCHHVRSSFSWAGRYMVAMKLVPGCYQLMISLSRGLTPLLYYPESSLCVINTFHIHLTVRENIPLILVNFITFFRHVMKFLKLGLILYFPWKGMMASSWVRLRCKILLSSCKITTNSHPSDCCKDETNSCRVYGGF